MKLRPFRITGARVLTPGGLADLAVSVADGWICDENARGRDIDLSGFWVMPGLVDIHGDGFEHHLAPRRGAMKDIDQGLITAEAELAANGITTAVMAQFYSWEGGMRGPEFADKVFDGITRAAPQLVTDLIPQLRFEIPMLEDYETLVGFVARHEIPYVVFNDHLPHEALARGKRPPRLTGQALRIGRNPEAHLAAMQAMHARKEEVWERLPSLTQALRTRGVRLGSHDDRSAQERQRWRDMGVGLAEFPETPEAAEAARRGGDGVIMGAPNVVRGGSHNGNLSALEAVAMGYCDALASDYHYPSMRRAALFLADAGVVSLAEAWALISQGPATLLGLSDRGALTPGQRADFVILEAQTRRICGTVSGGAISYMTGPLAARFIG